MDESEYDVSASGIKVPVVQDAGAVADPLRFESAPRRTSAGGSSLTLLAGAILAVAIAASAVMFTLKTTPHSASSTGSPFAPVAQVHPAWATAAGFGFLLAGLVSAALILAANRKRW